MLNMLNVLGKTWGTPPFSSSSPPNIQHIQHIQHFCRKKHILIQHGAPEFNIFNISPERSTFSQKNASFRGNVEYVEFSGQGSPSNFSQNIQHIQHIQHFCRKKHILIQHGAPEFNIFNISPERSTFSQKMLLSGEMLNMLNSLNRGSPSSFPQNIQHIQHIQHFCKKKRILIQHGAPEFNIFNISPERTTFFRKCASFRGNVEYVEFFGHVCVNG